MSLETEDLSGRQELVARIAGAMAHELNNPLQGLLSLAAVCKAESQGQNLERLELVHCGLLRLAQVVQCLSAVYENQPRSDGEIAVGSFLSALAESLDARGIRADVASTVPPGTTIAVLGPEIVRLITEAFSIPSPTDGCLKIRMDVMNGRVLLTCERESMDAAEPWCGLTSHHICSGLAVLIDEMTKLAGGDPEFRFDHASMSGIRLCFRTRMN
jgi:hypothetical protein